MYFTQKTISLKETVHLCKNLRVICDAHFSYAGKIPSAIQPRIVSCLKPIHITQALEQKGIVGIVTTEDLKVSVPEGMGLAISDVPLECIYTIHEYLCNIPDFHWQSFKSRIDPTAFVSSTAYIAENDVVIGPFSYIHPNATILPRSVIGSHCAVGSGTVIGADAFEVNKMKPQREILKQAGGVILQDHVEIQSLCTVVRSTFGGFTVIGAETKLDCHIHVAHDCQIGKKVQIAACAELSGRVSVGDNTFIGPNSTISNGITIGDNSHITLGSVVTDDVESNSRVSGNFAIKHSKFLRFIRGIR